MVKYKMLPISVGKTKIQRVKKVTNEKTSAVSLLTFTPIKVLPVSVSLYSSLVL